MSRSASEWIYRAPQWHLGCNDHGQLVVVIDDKELSMEEFGRMLTTYSGWGMRIEFVPDDELHRRPALVVREPDPEKDSSEG